MGRQQEGVLKMVQKRKKNWNEKNKHLVWALQNTVSQCLPRLETHTLLVYLSNTSIIVIAQTGNNQLSIRRTPGT